MHDVGHVSFMELPCLWIFFAIFVECSFHPSWDARLYRNGSVFYKIVINFIELCLVECGHQWSVHYELPCLTFEFFYLWHCTVLVHPLPDNPQLPIFHSISVRGPLSLLVGMLHFAFCKMFAECMFSWKVIVFDYKASAFHICKNFARHTFSQRVIVFDYQASMFCICKFFCKTYICCMDESYYRYMGVSSWHV